jgi:hypothetical protein
MYKIKFYLITIVILFSNCNDYPLSQNLLNSLYPERDFKGILPKVVYQNSIILNKELKPNNIYVLRDKNEELICILENEKVYMADKYIMLNYGPMKYNYNIRNFESEPIKETNKPFIIQDISFHKFKGDEFYSVFVSVFSEEPPLGFFLVPMIYRNGVKIFDGLNNLGEEEFLKKWKIVSYSFDSGNIFTIKFPGGEKIKYLWKEDRFFRLPNKEE